MKRKKKRNEEEEKYNDKMDDEPLQRDSPNY